MSRSYRTSPRRLEGSLAVHSLAGQLAWLEGRARWDEGRVVWERDGIAFEPSPSDFARAQRNLTKLSNSPRCPARLIGEYAPKLELAKRFHAMRAPDLAALARESRSRNPAVLARLTELLLAEAICLNSLPITPSRSLLNCGALGAASSRELSMDETAPLQGRALAALAWGAWGHRHGESPRGIHGTHEAMWLRRAYAYGFRHGLPDEPALAVALLQCEDGEELIGRCQVVLRSAGPVVIPVSQLREMLDKGVSGERLVAGLEILAAARPLMRRLINPTGYELVPEVRRRELVARAMRERAALVAELGEILRALFQHNCEPESIGQAVIFIERMLELGPFEDAALEAAMEALRAGRELSNSKPRLVCSYFQILCERNLQIWNLDSFLMPRHTKKAARKQTHWFREMHRSQVVPIVSLLRSCGDKNLVCRALDSGFLRHVASRRWCAAELCDYCLDVMAFLQPTRKYRASSVAWAVGDFKDAAAARKAIDPVLQALREASETARERVKFQLVDAVATSEWANDAELHKIHRIASIVLEYADKVGDDIPYYYSVESLISLRGLMGAKSSASETVRWCAWAAQCLLGFTKTELEEQYWIEEAMELAVLLAAGDFALFQELLPVLVRVPDRYYSSATKAGAEALRNHSNHLRSLAVVFPKAARRRIALLERLGLALKFDPRVLEPLRENEEPVVSCATETSNQIRQLAPDLYGALQRFERAWSILKSPPKWPREVIETISLLDKMRRELEYLERRLEAEPRFTPRAEKLKQRLADEAGFREQMRRSLRDSLLPALAKTEVSALEHVVAACFQERLEKIAGPLPEMKLDDDLMNAALLSLEIDDNRPLLRDLLRAELGGEKLWRGRHPANARLLEGLIEADIDVGAWLDSWPQQFPCAGSMGGRVRLWLETRPLRILQMGNYFDTCLSVMGCNSFSTVANACELNKRVIYAVDSLNRTVGRQLIGLNEKRELVGFRVYTSLATRQSNERLRTIFDAYTADFAERCGIRRSNSGTVPRLFAKNWYDDGTVQWMVEDGVKTDGWMGKSYEPISGTAKGIPFLHKNSTPAVPKGYELCK